MSKLNPAMCHLWSQPPLLFIETNKNRVSLLKFRKLSKTSMMTRGTPPCVMCLIINSIKNRMSSHVNDIILIKFNFLREFQICNQNQHASPGAPPTKNRNTMHVIEKRSKRLKTCQGSVLHTQNLNLRLGSQAAKSRKFLHVTRKNSIGISIMQGPTFYAQYCQMRLRSLSPKK
jgi:hypothetical protein